MRITACGLLGLWIVAVAAGFATGCSSSSSTPSIGPDHGTQDDRTIARGQSTSIALASNPSTGFSWSLDEARSSGLAHVKVVDKGFTRTTSGLVGAPGRRWWSVAGLTRGTASLTFVYQRAWDRQTPPAKARTIVVDVR